MTPREMLIGIDLILQKVNSNAISSFGDDEKLWFLNEECIRYISSRTNPFNDKKLGLDENEKRYDDLENLKTPAILPAFISSDGISVYSFLPADYVHLINDRSLTKDLCGATYNPPVVTQNIFTAIYTLPTDSDNFFLSLVVRVNSNVIFTVADIYPNGIGSNEASFMLISILIDKLNSISGIEAKYESFKNVSSNGAIIIASNITFTVSNIYNSSSTPKTVNFGITSTSYNKAGTITGVSEYNNRLTKSEDIYTLLNTNFGGTLPDSPLSTLKKGSIIVFHKKKFMLSSINIDYIRRPKKINVLLNQGCELDENVHQEIVDNVAKRLAAYTFSSGYNNIINENLLKE